MTVDPEKILEFLHAVERGEIGITPVYDPADRWAFYSGVLEFRATNGWRFGVFLDAGEWDYVEWLVTATGERAVYGDFERFPALREYEPAADAVVRHYGVVPAKHSGPRPES